MAVPDSGKDGGAGGTARAAAFWAALFALALALRVFRLDGQSVFWDDYNGLVGLAEPRFLDSILAARDVNPEGMPLYHVVQYLFRGLIGDSPLAMRGLSVALGLTTLPLVYGAAAAAFGPRAGRLAALLFAVSPQHIYHDQSIRNYPLAVLLAMAAVWAMIRAERGGGRRFLALNLVLNTALVWTQLVGVFAVAAQGAAFFLAAPRRVRRWAGWALCQGLLLAPAALWIMTMPHVPERGYWHFHPPDLLRVVSDLCAMDYLPHSPEIAPAGAEWRLALGPFATDGPLFTAAAAWAQMLAGAGCLAWAALWTARRAARNTGDKTGAGGVLVLLAVAVVPAAALAAVSHLWRPMYYPRYFLYSTPCLYALMGGAWAALPRRLPRGAFLAALAVLYGHQLCLLLPGTTRTPWKETGRMLLGEARPDDLVLVGGRSHSQLNMGLLTANMPPNGLTISTAHTVDAAVLKAAAALCPQAPPDTARVPEGGAVFYVTCLEWGWTRLDGLREGLALFGLEVRETTLPGGESLAVFRITRPAQGAPKPFGQACAEYWGTVPDTARTVSGEDLGPLLDRAGGGGDRTQALRLMRLVYDDGDLPETGGEQATLFAYFLLQEGAYDLSGDFLDLFIAETKHPMPDLLRTAHDAIRAFREGRREDTVRHLAALDETARGKYWEVPEVRTVSCLTRAAMLGALGARDEAERALAEAGANGAKTLPVYPVIATLARGQEEDARREMERFRATVPGSRDTFFRLLGLGPWCAPGAAAALCAP